MASTSSSGPAIRLWARSEVALRWRPLVVLGITAGLVAGLALAALDGAGRTSSAYDRFREATRAPDAVAFATLVGIFDQDYSAARELPEVVDAGTFTLAPVGIKEFPLGALPPGDPRLYRTVARPLLTSGRLPDPTRPDEILVNRSAAKTYDLRVGQRLTLTSSTDMEATGPPSGGPEQPATIVGIGDGPMELIFGSDPGFTPSAGFLAAYPEIPRAPNLVVRLRPGTDVNEFHRRAAEAIGVPELPVRDLAEDRKRITQGTDLERTGLMLFAGAALLAGLVMVGQALARTVYAMADPLPTLRAMGFTLPNRVLGLVLPLLLTAATAAAAAVASGIALSGRFPVGLARQIDPDLGLRAAWDLLLPGAAALILLVLGGGAFAALRATHAEAVHRPAAPGSAIVRAIRGSAPLPVAIGAGLALEAGRRDRALPVRPAIAGAVAGILGVVGALGLTRGIDDALARPDRSGQVWDAIVDYPLEEREAVLGALGGHAGVGQVADVRRLPLDVDGAAQPVYALEQFRGDLSFVVLEGRAPRSPGEAAIAPASAKALGKSIGDRVEVGGAGGMTFRIVGTTLVPQTAHSSFDQGLWIPAAAVERFGEQAVEGDGFGLAIVTARSGTSSQALVERLQQDFGGEVNVEPPSPPQDVLLLENVRTLPRAFAVFLVVLGLAALGHALVTAVRRRRHDLAVLRALGFRPLQNGACIVWQAVTVALVGLVLGIPFGVIVGYRSWQWVADSTPLLYKPPLAVAAVVLAVPASILVANLLAALPARRAARLEPAEVLRSE